MSNSILLATFGSASDDTRKLFGTLAAEISAAFPAFEVRTAFTSNFMIRKLARRNIFVPTFGSASDEVRKLFGTLAAEVSAAFPAFEVRTADDEAISTVRTEVGKCNE